MQRCWTALPFTHVGTVWQRSPSMATRRRAVATNAGDSKMEETNFTLGSTGKNGLLALSAPTAVSETGSTWYALDTSMSRSLRLHAFDGRASMRGCGRPAVVLAADRMAAERAEIS